MNHDDNKVYVGRRVKLYPTKEQEQMLFRYLELYRFVYNWGINREYTQYEYHKKDETVKGFIEDFALMREFKKELKTNPELSWFNDEKYPEGTWRLALRDVTKSFKMFFKGHNKHPRFKSRKYIVQTFKTRKDRCYIDNGKLRIEGLPRGEMIGIKTHAYDGFNGYPQNNHNGFCDPSITFNGNYFYLSFLYQVEKTTLDGPETDVIGIDLGIRNTFTLSTGEKFHRPSTKRLENKLKRIDRQLQKRYKPMLEEAERTKTKFVDIPKSRNCKKYEKRNRKLCSHMANIKVDYCYKVAKDIIERKPKAVCMETIGVEDMKRKQKPHIRKQIHQEPFYKYRTIMEQQCNKYNIPFVLADPHFPSTQKCSKCGETHKVGPSKVFICPYCGYVEDRDINAAINLKYYAYDVLHIS